MKAPRQRGRVENLGGGRFKVTVYVGLGPDGRRLYHRKTLRDSTEAKAWKHARTVAASADAGDYFTPARVTVGSHCEEWLERQRRDGVRQTTLATITRHIRNHLVPACGADTPLGKVRTRHLQQLYDRLQDEGCKPSFIRLVHATAKRCLKHAVKHGRLQSNPADLAELPKRNKLRKARVFDEAEALRFVEAAWRERKYLVFVFALLTGMRPSEFFGLEYTDLSLEGERGVARVTKGVVWDKGRWHVNEPKTEAGRRTIYFPAVIYHELMAQRGAHLEELRRLGQRHQFVFTAPDGQPLKNSALTRRFRAACRAAGLETSGRSLYTLRRSHATLSLLAGDNLKSLSERMGHCSVEFTQNEYVDALPAMQQRAADGLESKLLRTHLAPSDEARPM